MIVRSLELSCRAAMLHTLLSAMSGPITAALGVNAAIDDRGTVTGKYPGSVGLWHVFFLTPRPRVGFLKTKYSRGEDVQVIQYCLGNGADTDTVQGFARTAGRKY